MSAKESRVQGGRHNTPRRSNSSRQPASHGAVAGSNIEAAPARLDSHIYHTADGDRVGNLRQQPQPLTLEAVRLSLEITVSVHALPPHFARCD
jgi:hypothetical protein